MNWRHRVALIEQWNRVNLVLTSKVLAFMYGPSFPELKIGEDDLITHGMSNDCIAQSWYRFLNTIGNPISLTKPEVKRNVRSDVSFLCLVGDKPDAEIPPVRDQHRQRERPLPAPVPPSPPSHLPQGHQGYSGPGRRVPRFVASLQCYVSRLANSLIFWCFVLRSVQV
jgi:hypothetical protein